MTDTPNLGLPRLVDNQGDGETTHNNAMNILDSIVQGSVKDRDLTGPPGGEAEGDRYLVKATATGAWATHEDDIAVYFNGYIFISPTEGMCLWIDDENVFMVYDGATWNAPDVVLNLTQSISNPPTTAEVLNIQTTFNAVLDSLRDKSGWVR